MSYTHAALTNILAHGFGRVGATLSTELSAEPAAPKPPHDAW